MKIRDILALIPEDSTDEALMAIQSIRINPYPNNAVLSCHLSHEFQIKIVPESRATANYIVTLRAEGWPDVVTATFDIVSSLKRLIYTLDEAIENGSYKPPRKPYAWAILPSDYPPPPPAHMDIPVWDADAKRWYDAEY